MPCNSHFAQLVDIFNTYFEAFEKRIEDEARTLLGPVARLEDLDLGIFVVVPHSLAVWMMFQAQSLVRATDASCVCELRYLEQSACTFKGRLDHARAWAGARRFGLKRKTVGSCRLFYNGPRPRNSGDY